MDWEHLPMSDIIFENPRITEGKKRTANADQDSGGVKKKVKKAKKARVRKITKSVMDTMDPFAGMKELFGFEASAFDYTAILKAFQGVKGCRKGNRVMHCLKDTLGYKVVEMRAAVIKAQ